jgi:hypothetical protein
MSRKTRKVVTWIQRLQNADIIAGQIDGRKAITKPRDEHTVEFQVIQDPIDR